MLYPLNNPQAKPVFGATFDSQTIHRMAPRWRAAAADPLIPTMAAAPDWALPMLQHVAPPDGNVRILTANDGQNLFAAIPLQRVMARWGVPWPILKSWTNHFSFSGIPMLPASGAEEAMAAMLQATRDDEGANAVLLERVPHTGAFFEAIAAAAPCPVAILDPFERAALKTGIAYNDWLPNALSAKKRKEYRRQLKRLSETGTLTFAQKQSGEPLAPWIDGFLALEQAGWKGAAGTALGKLENWPPFLSEALGRLDDAGNLRFWRYTLDGRTIATLFAMISGRQAWLGKIAYDEALARYSPGVLLMLETTRSLLAEPDVDLVDSSAIPGHPMIDHVWRDRIELTDLLIATPGTRKWQFNLMVRAEKARRRGIGRLRNTYRRIKKKRVS